MNYNDEHQNRALTIMVLLRMIVAITTIIKVFLASMGLCPTSFLLIFNPTAAIGVQCLAVLRATARPPQWPHLWCLHMPTIKKTFLARDLYVPLMGASLVQRSQMMPHNDWTWSDQEMIMSLITTSFFNNENLAVSAINVSNISASVNWTSEDLKAAANGSHKGSVFRLNTRHQGFYIRCLLS